MFRAFQVKLSSAGAGTVDVGPPSSAMEWDIYQISVKTLHFNTTCQVQILHNGFFLCASPQGSLDTATGPPDVVINPQDDLTVTFTGGSPNDTATVGIWYNENPVGTTISLTH